MHRLTYHLKIDNFKNLARYCPFAVIKVFKNNFKTYTNYRYLLNNDYIHSYKCSCKPSVSV